jgi:nucleotide-binding universal stress UspA family protein
VFESIYEPIAIPGCWHEEMLAAAQAYVVNLARQLPTDTLRVQAKVLEGDPATQILAYAEESRVVLIALTTSCLTGGHGRHFGSVAEKLIQATSTSLLLLPPHKTTRTLPREGRYQSIAIPLDGSVYAEQALDQAQRLACALGTALVLVSVVPTRNGSMTERDSSSWTAHVQEAEAERRTRYLEHKAWQVRDLGVTARTEVATGRPAEEILRISTQQHLNLLVMASHGRSDLQRLCLGSVAVEVIHEAELPVLLVRTKEGTDQAKRGEDRPLG